MSLHSGLNEGNSSAHQGWNVTNPSAVAISPSRQIQSKSHIRAIYITTPSAHPQLLNRNNTCFVSNSSQMIRSSQSACSVTCQQSSSPHHTQPSPLKCSPSTPNYDTQTRSNSQTSHMTSPHAMSYSPLQETKNQDSQVPSQYPSISTHVASNSVDCQPSSDHDCVLVGSSQQNVFRFPETFHQKLIAPGQVKNHSVETPVAAESPNDKSRTSPSIKVIGNKELVKNTVYLLKSPKGGAAAMMAKWDGEQFVEYDTSQADLASQQQKLIEQHGAALLKSSLAGGGGGLTRKVRQSRPLKGFAMGLNMASGHSNTNDPSHLATSNSISNTTDAKPPDQQDASQNILPNGRVWHHTVNPLARRPLHQDDNTGEGDRGTDNIEIIEEGGPKAIKAINNAPPHPNNKAKSTESEDTEMSEQVGKDEVQDKSLAVCSYCGFTGLNNERCERCRRILSDGHKVFVTNKRLRTEDLSDRRCNSIDKRSFYGKKLSEHANILEGSRIIVLNSNNPGASILSQAHLSSLDNSPVTKPKRSAPRVRKRKPIIVTEPVTISSDEEEPSTYHPADSPMPSTNIPAVVNEMSQDSNHSSEFSDHTKNNCSEEQDIFPHNPSPKFLKGLLTRKSELELEDGQRCAESEKISSFIPDFVNAIINDDKVVSCECRSFRVGSFKGEPIGLLNVSMKGLHCEVEAWNGDVCNIGVKPIEIEQLMYCACAKLTVFFFQPSFECGVRLRKFLLMKEKSQIYFDPTSEQRYHQFITVILDSKGFPEQKQYVMDILNYYKSQHHSTKADYIKQLNYEMANSLLVSCTANVDNLLLNAKVFRKATTGVQSPSAPSTPLSQQECNRDSPSPPKIGFAGPIERLIIYPPPPTAGGVPVSNEDLYCLNEGEFLNDVIIDFYLKYFYLEELSAEDRERTHIFSSFFYRRLTQRERKFLQCDDNEDEEDTTPIEKRHSRVKTWTRHVDLFQKDFIIVPINEHSHWFLAIICFPGRLKEEHVMYLPRSKLIPQSNDDSEEKTTQSKTDNSSALSEDSELPDLSDIKPDPSDINSGLSERMEQSGSESQTVKNHSSPLSHLTLTSDSGELPSSDNPGNQTEAVLQDSQLPDLQEPMETDGPCPDMNLQSVNPSICDNNSENQDTDTLPDLNSTSQNTQLDQCPQNPDDQLPCGNNVTNDFKQDPSQLTDDVKNENMFQPSPSQNVPKTAPIREGKEVIGRELTDEEIEAEERKKDWVGGMRRPCILVFDSLIGPSRSNVVRILREYLQVEWKVKKKTERTFDRDTIKGGNPKVPQQDNYSDCGIYVLQYVESFFKNPIMDYSIPMRIPNWFDLKTVSRKRQEIIDLITSIQVEQSKLNKPRR